MTERKKRERKNVLFDTSAILKNDCFANAGIRCAILQRANCNDCQFYKTQEQYRQAEIKAAQRLKSLVGITL